MEKHLRLDKAAFMLDVGGSSPIRAREAPEGSEILWESSNPAVALVGADGLVTGVSQGDAVIRAEAGGSVRECTVSVGYEGQNPCLPPSWGLFIADGEPHVFHGRVYVYGSRDCPNGFMAGAPKNDWCSDDYHVIWSDDLVHWTDAGRAVSIDCIPEEIRGTGTRLWAPDLFKGPVDGRYYLTFCTNGADIYIADADNPAGPFGNIKKMTMAGAEVKCIDPAALVDGDEVYIALPFDFIIARLDPGDYSRILPESKTVLRHVIDAADPDYYPFEGPSLRKRGGLYYYIYIASRKGEHVPTRMDYLISENLMTDRRETDAWRYGGHFIETRDFIRAGNVHGSFCEFGGETYLSYHRMAPGYERFTRMLNLDRLEFGPNGRAVCERTSSGAKGAFRLGETIQAASACAFSGGRDDDRFVLPGKDGPPPGCPPGYAYVRLEAGAWVSYKWAGLGETAVGIELCWRCAEDSKVALTLIQGDAEYKYLVDAGGGAGFRTARHPLELPRGCCEVRFELAPSPRPVETAGFELVWFRFIY